MKSKTTARSVYSITRLQSLYRELATELHIEPIELQITPTEMQHLQSLVYEKGGIRHAAAYVGVHVSAYLTACAGFAHVLRPHTIRKLRKFLDKWKVKP